MTNHNDPQFERTIEASLTQHSLELGSPSGQLDDVMARVDRRRNRRRSVAVVGSLAAISVGVFGIASVSGRNPDQIPGLANTDASVGESFPPPTAGWAAYPDAWACQVPVNVANPQPDTQYFQWCEPYGAAPVFEVPGTSPTPTTDVYAYYEVAEGDYLFSIAAIHGVGPLEIAFANGWSDGADHVLNVGDLILIPAAVTQAPPSIPNSHPTDTTTTSIWTTTTIVVPAP